MTTTCRISYIIDPHKIDAFINYATRWPPIVERCGGNLIGYFLPTKDAPSNQAFALLEFHSLRDYADYRGRLDQDREAQANVADAAAAGVILIEDRSFYRKP